MNLRVEFQLRDTLDRRTLEQLASYESIERKRYEWRVARNAKERARIARVAAAEQLPSLLRPQAG
jgi:hypothetical protein